MTPQQIEPKSDLQKLRERIEPIRTTSESIHLTTESDYDRNYHEGCLDISNTILRLIDSIEAEKEKV